MNVAIAGFDREGKSSYQYFSALGHTLTILDQNEKTEMPAGATAVLGKHYLDNLGRFDLIVRTAGLPPRLIFGANLELDSTKVTTQVNEFFKACPTKNIIGVTGTKGKGTTSTLIYQMLNEAGIDAHLAGNIGLPALELLPKLTADSWVVLELSSFQLTDLKSSPHIAVCLMVEPEHLDWHIDMADYIDSKRQLFAHQAAEDTAIYYSNNETSKAIAANSSGTKITYYSAPGAAVENDSVVINGRTICSITDIKLPGKHNWQNVCAAVTAVWQVTQNVDAIRNIIKTFIGLPFRIEYRKTVNEIVYYNDSFATGGGATTAAIKAIPNMKVLIIGGYDRMLDLTNFATAVAGESATIRKVVLIGVAAKRMSEVLQSVGFENFVLSGANTMKAIVQMATSFAKPGDAVVLSPGFASYDMFKNFEERGKQFNAVVENL